MVEEEVVPNEEYMKSQSGKSTVDTSLEQDASSFNFESSRGYNSQPQDGKQDSAVTDTSDDLGMDFAG